MHLHWKYRELVKVCIGRKRIEEVHGIARTLEAESGGILVAVEPVSKGFAIIVYRGKNYTRPASLRPRTLLSKREAMKRSLEAQRRESLKLHVLKLSKHVDSLKLKMAKDEDRYDMQLTRDLKFGPVDQENNETRYFDDKISDSDPESDSESYVSDPSDEAREPHGTDATLTDSVDFTRQNLPGDVSLGSAVKDNYLFGKTEAEVQPKSLPKETKDFLNTNKQSKNVGKPEDQIHSSYNVGGHQNAELKTSVQKALNETPLVTPSKAFQLSNRERLLLRKQALKLKRPPVLAVGKSNVIVGVARAIKDHFKRHPLAIVHIKGRAKGTSAREVIYNLEQATGGVLVSQEPSKIILYRGWGSGIEPEQPKYGEPKAQPPVSPELISAIRFECGLKSIDEEHMPSEDDKS